MMINGISRGSLVGVGFKDRLGWSYSWLWLGLGIFLLGFDGPLGPGRFDSAGSRSAAQLALPGC